MNSGIERIIYKCISSIERGHGIEYCLKKYGKYGKEVAGFLDSIKNIQEIKKIKPDENLIKKCLDRVIKRAEKEGTPDHPLPGESGKLNRTGYPVRRLVLRPAMIFITILVLAIFSFSGTLFAAQDSIPGQALYPLKRTFEDFKLLVYPESKKGNLHFQFLNNRIEEADLLISSGDNTSEIFLIELLEDIDEQYGLCSRYGLINPNNEKDILDSVNRIRNRYREKFGNDPSGNGGTYPGDTGYGKNYKNGNTDGDSGYKKNDSGDTGSAGNSPGSTGEKHDGSSQSQGRK
ncbi:MAG: hypothetical protein JW770_01735 [Actinobacteria bacterium]|nr:hypothetical protein [Actinomycetota bacterium]